MKRAVILLPGQRELFENYDRAVEQAGGAPMFWQGGAMPEYDGLLLCGGADIEPWRYGQENTASTGLNPKREELELEALEAAVTAGKPVLGICRGMQLTNVFFGGTLCQDIPGHSKSAGRDRLHRVETEPSFLRELYGETAVVNSAHHQSVERLGAGLRVVQRAPDGTAEGLCHHALPVWGVQWHPERLRGRYALAGAADGDRLFRAFLEMCL